LKKVLLLVFALSLLTFAALPSQAVPPAIMPKLPESKGQSPNEINVHSKAIDLEGASANKVKAVELLNEATEHAQNGEYADAARNLEDAILYLNDSDAQLSAALHMNLGSVYDQLGKFEGAVSEYEMAAKLNPREIEILYNKAMVFEKLKRYDDAIALLSQYVAKQSDPKLQHEALAAIDRIKTEK